MATKKTPQPKPVTNKSAVPNPSPNAAAQKNARSRKAGLSEEIGSTGLIRFGGTIDEEFHNMLRGKRGVRAFREMRDNDATIGASLWAIISLLRGVVWTVVPADDSPDSLAAAKFLEENLEDMNHTWADFMNEILSMLWFGWSLFEKVYKVRGGKNPGNPKRNSKFSDGRIGIHKIAIRAQETLDDWEFDDETGDITGMWQSAAPDFRRNLIPSECSVLFRVDRSKNNPEGRSLLRNSWRSWFFLKRMQEIEAIGIERDLVGLPVMELPPSYMDESAGDDKKNARANFLTLIQQIRRNEHEGILVPSVLDEEGNPTGFKLSLLSTAGSRQLDINGSITRYEQRVAMTMLTQFLFLGQGETGSFALSSDQTNLFAVSLGSIMDAIEETFDSGVTQELYELNGVPEENRAKLEHGDIEHMDLEKVGRGLLGLVDGGIITPDRNLEAWARERGGLPARDDNNEDADDDIPVDPGEADDIDDPNPGLQADAVS